MLRRHLFAIPHDVAKALKSHRVSSAYGKRPAYQRNDYLGWIVSAKQPDTRNKRIAQMIDELKCGNVYMKMDWHPRISKSDAKSGAK